ncbi:ASCH domain-containing protein [Knoellia sp. CPCC 206435]|uniref:ASCH domain-containing protein n=1 Tax=Knoellia terrae TaxID=3404797 RepID=UPI003B429E7E
MSEVQLPEHGSEHDDVTGVDADRDERVAAFWEVARLHAKISGVPAYFGPTPLESVPPPAWSFGDGADQADGLLDLVLAGTKTATASALWDYEAEDEPLPEPGALSIILDGSGHPRALIETTDVEVVPFDEVEEEHARLEGEGDLSLAHWREVHERFFTATASHGHGFVADMPVVCERFRVLHAD